MKITGVLGCFLALSTAAFSGIASIADHANEKSQAQRAPITLRALYGMPKPSRLDPSRTALVLVDFQDEFIHGKLRLSDGPRAVLRAAKLLDFARSSRIQVVHVQNVVKRPDSPVFAEGSNTTAIVPELAPAASEMVLTKSMAGAFSRTDLDARLRALGVDTLIIAGLMTHLAVQTTASDAMVLGYRVIVAADGTATRALPGAGGYDAIDATTLHRAALSAMADRVADVMTTQQITALQLGP